MIDDQVSERELHRPFEDGEVKDILTELYYRTGGDPAARGLGPERRQREVQDPRDHPCLHVAG